MEKIRVHSLLKKVRQSNPFIYYLTAFHEATFIANGLFALGAAPIYGGAVSASEIAQAIKNAKAVILNMDSLVLGEEKCITSGKFAGKHNIPLIFDSSGVGFTTLKNQAARQLLKEIGAAVIHGSPSEIAYLIGEQWDGASEGSCFFQNNECELALLAAKRLGMTIVLSGKEKIISDGLSTYSVHNQDPLLKKTAGSGYLLSAVIGTCAAVEKDPLAAALSALLFYGVAAEIAANKTEGLGLGSFQIEFINQLSLLSSSDLSLYGSYTKVRSSS